MRFTKTAGMTLACVLTYVLMTGAADGSRPPQKQKDTAHTGHHDGVDQRGDHVMGFSHEKTSHHFRLTADGGLIEVIVNDDKDGASRDMIRSHLGHIARKFAAGDFTAPMLIHARTPPGVPVLRKLKSRISWQFEETESGGRVRMRTDNARAITAMHKFLRFQIADHRTGDSGRVEKGL
ncbi:MAG: hypothetical protein ACKV2V_00805 [Blastocatellia bacterium]